MDGYMCRIVYRVLPLFKDSRILVARPFANTSHVLKPLDLSVFGHIKEEFNRLLSLCAVLHDIRNDIFTIYEIFCSTYHTCITASRIVTGFRKSGIWSIKNRDVTWKRFLWMILHLLSSTRNIWMECRWLVKWTKWWRQALTRHESSKAKRTFSIFFCNPQNESCSDDMLVDGETVSVSTTIGAILTSNNDLSALQQREERRVAQIKQAVDAQEARAKRKVEQELN